MSAHPTPKFAVGDLIVDRETGVEGVVVYRYEDPRLAGEIVAVKFDVGDVPVAVPVDTIRRGKGAVLDKGSQVPLSAPVAKRRRRPVS